ncbi:MAG: TerB family tellurite resistance protein [Pseudomonadota bacterium]
MIKSLLSLFGAKESIDAEALEHQRNLAAAALLIEMTRADYSVDDAEKRTLAAALQESLAVSEAEITELVSLAEAAADKATSLYEFTRLINDHYSPDEKRSLIHCMWRVAYADGNLDKYEERLIRQVSDLIHVSHKDFIRIKMEVAESAG